MNGANTACPACGGSDWGATAWDETTYSYDLDATSGKWVDTTEDLTNHSVGFNYVCNICGEVFEESDNRTARLPVLDPLVVHAM